MMNESNLTKQIIDPLSPDEEEQLVVCESEIAQGIDGFRDTVRGLSQIKNKNLWRVKHSTFEEYCDKRWGFSRQHVYRLIQAADVLENIPVQSERQARALAHYTKSFQQTIWMLAEETAPKTNGKPRVTASHVAALVEVTKELLLRQVMADSAGEVHPLGFFFDLNVTEAEREHLLRQKEYIRQDISRREESKRQNGAKSPASVPEAPTGTQVPLDAESPATPKAEPQPAAPEMKARLLLRVLETWIAGEDKERTDRNTALHPAKYAVYHFTMALLGKEKFEETEMRALGGKLIGECDSCGTKETQVEDYVFTNTSTQRLSSVRLALCGGCVESYQALNQGAKGEI